MKQLLICPSERPAVGALGEARPLVTVPLLGQSLVEYWLSHLACAGVTQVMVLAADRAEHVKALVGNGARWGLAVQVNAESRELGPAQAELKYGDWLEARSGKNSFGVLDHLPGRPENSLFAGYQAWFSELKAWMPHANTPDRVGLRELAPGIWIGLQSRISSKARLHAPCWIGKNVFVGPDSELGPGTIIEDRAFIDGGAELSNSYIAADTYVGRLARIADSIAWGGALVDLLTGSIAIVPDPFVLCLLREPEPVLRSNWYARVLELYARNKAEVQALWKQVSIHKGH